MGKDSGQIEKVSRRGVLSGVGAALLGGALVGAKAADATVAAPRADGTDGVAPPSERSAGVAPHTSPVTTTIASAAKSGHTYRTVCMYDFFPFNPAAQKTWGGSGIYSAGTGTTMRATVEIPPGALVREVEYYIYNNSTSIVFPDAFLYVAGQGAISSIGASTPVAINGSAITTSTAVPSAQGPYPLGSRLLVSVSTPSTGTVQINGARVAFSAGAGTVGLLAVPVRAYDSQRSGGKLAANSTRLITLPAGLFPPGTTGMIANITVLGSSGDGSLTVFRADVSKPPINTMRYGKSTATSEFTVEVSAGRQIKVQTSRSVHLFIDVLGTTT